MSVTVPSGLGQAVVDGDGGPEWLASIPARVARRGMVPVRSNCSVPMRATDLAWAPWPGRISLLAG